MISKFLLSLFFCFSNIWAETLPLEGITSPFSSTLAKMAMDLKNEKNKDLNLKNPQTPIEINCYDYEENKNNIILKQKMLVKSPLLNIAKVIENFEKYHLLFPGLIKVEASDFKSNQFKTFWQQEPPLFFLSKAEFKLNYLMEEGPKFKIYYYRLIEGDYLNNSEGFIFLKSLSSNETFYYEMDFIDPKLGIAKILHPDTIWQEAVKNIVVSDLAIKFKSEEPARSEVTSLELATEQVLKNEIKACIRNKITVKNLF